MNKEKVDLVDKNGIIIRREVLRSDIALYSDLYLQIVIGVILDRQGKVLVHQRSLRKTVNGGDVDHVCGAVMSGEPVAAALVRETEEETGLRPHTLRIIERKVNSYNRYRHLYVAYAEGTPVLNPRDAEWVAFKSHEELRSTRDTGSMTFVGEFFDDLDKALFALQT